MDPLRRQPRRRPPADAADRSRHVCLRAGGLLETRTAVGRPVAPPTVPPRGAPLTVSRAHASTPTRNGPLTPRGRCQHHPIARVVGAGRHPPAVGDGVATGPISSPHRWSLRVCRGLRASAGGGQPEPCAAGRRGIIRQHPRQLSAAFALRPWDLVVALIAQHHGVEKSLPVVGLLIRRLGSPPRRPPVPVQVQDAAPVRTGTAVQAPDSRSRESVRRPPRRLRRGWPSHRPSPKSTGGGRSTKPRWSLTRGREARSPRPPRSRPALRSPAPSLGSRPIASAAPLKVGLDDLHPPASVNIEGHVEPTAHPTTAVAPAHYRRVGLVLLPLPGAGPRAPGWGRASRSRAPAPVVRARFRRGRAPSPRERRTSSRASVTHGTIACGHRAWMTQAIHAAASAPR